MDYLTAKKDFLNGKIQGCKNYFKSRNYRLEQGYCEIILDNLSGAKEIFEGLKDEDFRAHWCLVMLEFIKGEASLYPTYFELRNFLEIDLNIFIMYCKGEYVEKIVRYADFMYTINPETYKFIGRVFLNNGLKPQGMFFLKRAKDRFYQDPELHYILAEVYKADGDTDLCRKSLETCLEILPNYAPAKALLHRVQALN